MADELPAVESSFTYRNLILQIYMSNLPYTPRTFSAGFLYLEQ